jgi:hypothetical protein
MAGKQHFRGFFYPWATVDPTTLKRALFYFDEITIRSPVPLGKPYEGPQSSIEALLVLLSAVEDAAVREMLSARVARIMCFHDDVAPLVEAGVLRLLTDNLPEYSIDADSLWNQIKNEESTLARPGSLGITASEIAENELVSIKLSAIKAMGPRGSPDLTEDELNEMTTLSVISMAAASDVLRSTPVTQDERFLQLYGDLIARAKYDRPTYAPPSLPANSGSHLLAAQIFEDHLPRFEFVSYSDILEARQKLRDELLAFRAYVEELAQQIRQEPFSEAFREEIQRKSNLTVAAALRDLERKVARSRNKFLIALARSIVAAAPLSLVTVVYPGAPPFLAWAAGAGLLAAGEIAKYVQDARTINGLSLILRSRTGRDRPPNREKGSF